VVKGWRFWAKGKVEGQEGALWPETPQHAQRTGSRQSSTK
jgi:hypothetical protein